VEALGARKALIYAVKTCFLNLHAELDNLLVIQSINGLHTDQSYLDLIVLDCAELKRNFYYVDFHHANMKANCVAHHLAKFALHNLDNIWIEEFPDSIAQFLSSNLSTINS